MKTRRWDFASAHAETFGVQRICRVLRVSRSGYHRWIAGAKTRQERQAADDALLVEIREIHTEHKISPAPSTSAHAECSATRWPRTRAPSWSSTH